MVQQGSVERDYSKEAAGSKPSVFYPWFSCAFLARVLAEARSTQNPTFPVPFTEMCDQEREYIPRERVWCLEKSESVSHSVLSSSLRPQGL